MPTTNIRTRYGTVEVSMPTPEQINIRTPLDKTVTINGVEYELRIDLTPAHEHNRQYGFGRDQRWYYSPGGGHSVQRKGWQNWNKPVSDAARKRVKEILSEAVDAIATTDNARMASVETARRAAASVQSQIETAERKLAELRSQLQEAELAEAAAIEEASVQSPRLVTGGNLSCLCGSDRFFVLPRSLDSYHFQCVECGVDYFPLTETGASR